MNKGARGWRLGASETWPQSRRKIGLYIHVPFCVRKCHYCDFVSYNAPQLHTAYVDTLLAEAKQQASRQDYQVVSVFIGGGTPTVLEDALLARLVHGIVQTFDIDCSVEFTVEANPGTVSSSKLSILKQVGVNRLSFGVQAFQAQLLQCLGRIHTWSEFEQNYKLARDIGFNNINIDLMYGLPGQTLADWQETLERTLAIQPEHVSAYGLKIEENTPFHQKYESGSLALPNEEDCAAMYELAVAYLAGAAYRRYEVSNFARNGYECQHNTLYWQYKEYLGMGPSATSFLHPNRWSNSGDLNQYLMLVTDGGTAIERREYIERRAAMGEMMFMGLRMTQGVDVRRFVQLFEVSVDEVYGCEIEKLEKLGLLIREDSYIRLTTKGMLLGNMVFAEFV